MIDKQFSMSSYLAFRYIEREGMNFYEGLKSFNIPVADASKFTYIHTAKDIDRELQKVFDSLRGEKLGICLSGGMESAILASYMRGCDAYTFLYDNQTGCKFWEKKGEFFQDLSGIIPALYVLTPKSSQNGMFLKLINS